MSLQSEVALVCLSCKKPCDPETFCGALETYAPAIDAARFRCPSCASSDDVRLADGLVCFGYVAGAGTAHFVGMIDVPVSGLSVKREGDALVVSLGERTWTVR